MSDVDVEKMANLPEMTIEDQCRLLSEKVKQLESGIDKLIIHYEILARVSYADSFNSKLSFEKFVEDLKKVRA